MRTFGLLIELDPETFEATREEIANNPEGGSEVRIVCGDDAMELTFEGFLSRCGVGDVP